MFTIGIKVLIVPGNIVYKGAKSVVEFIVNNYTMVDAGGNRDTKKVAELPLTDPCSSWWSTSSASPTTTSPPASSPPSCWVPWPTSPSSSTSMTSMIGANHATTASVSPASSPPPPQVHGLPHRPAGARLHDARVHGGAPQGLVH